MPTIKPLPKEAALRFENLNLRDQLSQAERAMLVRDTCEEAKIPVPVCNIQLDGHGGGTVTQVPAANAAPVAPATAPAKKID